MGFLRSIFGGPGDPDWLRRVAALCERFEFVVVWTRPAREIEVRAGIERYPTLWLDSRGRVEVAPFEGDVDHPGFRLRPPEDDPDETLRRIASELGSPVEST